LGTQYSGSYIVAVPNPQFNWGGLGNENIIFSLCPRLPKQSGGQVRAFVALFIPYYFSLFWF